MKLPASLRLPTRPVPLVLVDTSEQTPLEPLILEGGNRLVLPTWRESLQWGDYGLPSLRVAIERKGGDFITTLFGSSETSVGQARANLDRFREELAALAEYDFAEVVIERHPRDVWREAREPGRRFDPAAAWGLFVSLEDYGVPIKWLGDRATAELYVGSRLTRIWRQHMGVDRAAKKARARGLGERLPWLRDEPTQEAIDATWRGLHVLAGRATRERWRVLGGTMLRNRQRAA